MVESQPAAQWQKKALRKTIPRSLDGAVGDGKSGEKNHAQQVFERLLEIKDLEMLLPSRSN